MRDLLAPYLGRRIRAVARFAGISRSGYSILEDVDTPGGKMPYTWVSWPGRLPFPGERVRFEATVRQYFAESRKEFDFGLKDLVVEP